MNKPENRLYLTFLSHVLPIFNNLNRLMQSESPKIQSLYKEITMVVKTILDFYIKEVVINSTNVENIDFKNPRNFLDINEMYFSAEINSYDLQDNRFRLERVKLNCLNFYIEGVTQIITRFPIQNSKFQKLEFLDPDVVTSRKIRTIAPVSKDFQNLINVDIQTIDNEWLALRNFEINFPTDDICSFWEKIASVKSADGTEQRFPNLTRLVFNLLCLPHSSANVERIFSQINLNKTKIRNRLNTSTLSAIIHTKTLVSKNNCNCSNFPIQPDLVSKLNQKIYEADPH